MVCGLWFVVFYAGITDRSKQPVYQSENALNWLLT